MLPLPAAPLGSTFAVRKSTSGAGVLCLGTEEWPAPAAIVATGGAGASADGATPKGRVQERLTKASGPRIAEEAVKIGGPFAKAAKPSFLADRASVYDRVIAVQASRVAGA